MRPVLLAVLLLAFGAADTAVAIEPAAVERHASSVERSLAAAERDAGRFRRWMSCVSEVPVSERGDVSGRGNGYQYDERDKTQMSMRTALALDASPTTAQYRFLRFSSRSGCLSRRTEPGGTADAARAASSSGRRTATAHVAKSVTARITDMRRRVRTVERTADQFDAWESCLSQLPVTEFGDPGGAFGYLFGASRRGSPKYTAAISIDRSEYDDPDYLFLGFRRGDQPGEDCDNDPGEAADRAIGGALTARTVADRLDAQLDDLDEDVEDAGTAMAEFRLFDQCMFLVGVASHDDYWFGRYSRRSALALDLDGKAESEQQFMAFPAEEPPGIECNEDAEPKQDDD